MTSVLSQRRLGQFARYLAGDRETDMDCMGCTVDSSNATEHELNCDWTRRHEHPTPRRRPSARQASRLSDTNLYLAVRVA